MPWLDRAFASSFHLISLGDPHVSSPSFREWLLGSGEHGKHVMQGWSESTQAWGSHAAAVQAETMKATEGFGLDESDLPCLLVTGPDGVEGQAVSWTRVSLAQLEFTNEADVSKLFDVLQVAFSEGELLHELNNVLGCDGLPALATRNRISWLEMQLNMLRQRPHEDYAVTRDSHLRAAWAVACEEVEMHRRRRTLTSAVVKKVLPMHVRETLGESAWAVLDVLIAADPDGVSAPQIAEELRRRRNGSEIQADSIRKSVLVRLRKYFAIPTPSGGYRLDTPFLEPACWE